MAHTPGTTDYRTLRPVKDGKVQERPANTRAPYDWWNKRGTECAQSVRSTVEFLQKNQQPRMRQQVVSARLYGNIPLSGTGGVAYSRLIQSQTAAKERLDRKSTRLNSSH